MLIEKGKQTVIQTYFSMDDKTSPPITMKPEKKGLKAEGLLKSVQKYMSTAEKKRQNIQVDSVPRSQLKAVRKDGKRKCKSRKMKVYKPKLMSEKSELSMCIIFFCVFAIICNHL